MSGEASDILRPGVEIKPRIDVNQSIQLIEKLYGVKCTSITELNAYDDRNYKITVAENYNNDNILKICEHGYIFKILNSLDSQKSSFVEAQNDMMIYLGKNNIVCPKPVRNKHGEYFSLEHIEGSGHHIIRLLEFLPGNIFCQVPATPDLVYKAGKYIANLDLVLKNFDHPVYKTHRTLWMLESVPEVQQFLHVITNDTDKKLIEEVVQEFESRVLKNISTLEKGILHGDFNEQNIVIAKTNDESWEIDAILDFGDTHRSCLLFELAVALTYMIIQGKSKEMAGYTLAGYETIRQIPEHEYKLLKVCVAARFCQSLVIGAYSNLQNPENKYVLTTQATGWMLLRELWNTPEEKLYENWKEVAEKYKKINK